MFDNEISEIENTNDIVFSNHFIIEELKYENIKKRDSTIYLLFAIAVYIVMIILNSMYRYEEDKRAY